MKNIFLFLLMTISIAVYANPAELFSFSKPVAKKKQTSGFDKTRLLLGPGLGFGAAYRSFSFNISPSLAYCLTDNFHVGTTVGFNYFQQATEYQNPIFPGKIETYKFKLPAYSFSVYARYIIKDFLIINVEPELNNTKFILNYPFDSYDDYDLTTGKINERSARKTFGSMLVGLGYSQKISKYGYSYFMVCYDVVQNPNVRYYQTLDYRAGIMISLWD